MKHRRPLFVFGLVCACGSVVYVILACGLWSWSALLFAVAGDGALFLALASVLLFFFATVEDAPAGDAVGQRSE